LKILALAALASPIMSAPAAYEPMSLEFGITASLGGHIANFFESRVKVAVATQ